MSPSRKAYDRKEITFSKDIAPIIFKHCVVCHQPDGIAPYSLLTYQEVRRRAELIKYFTERRLMPPWKAAPDYGQFKGVRRLKDQEIETIKRWVDEGSPEGIPGDLPPTPQLADGWYLGKPDVVLQMPRPFSVPAGPDFYRCFVIPTHFKEDRSIAAFQVRPSDPRVIHHAIVVADLLGAGERLERRASAGYRIVLGRNGQIEMGEKLERQRSLGYPCYGGFGFLGAQYLGFWVHGMVPRFFPQGVAQLLRKSSDLVVQVHFHPTNKPAEEQIAIGLYFPKRFPQRIATDFVVSDDDIDIPNGAKNYKIRAFAYVPHDVEALSVFAHAHFLAKQVKVSATLPDGTVKPLLKINDWDPGWAEQYWFASPVFLPQGTRVDVEYTFDNSAANPHNPNHPPKRVTWGFRAVDEMAEIHLEVVPVNPPATAKRQVAGK